MDSEIDAAMPRIVVGGVPEHFNLPWHQAIDKNAFSAVGADLEFIEFRDGTGAMTRALRDREIDIALLLTEGCLADLLKGNPSQIVKTYVRSPLIWGIHVAADGEVKSVDQIRGKRYAISRYGSGSHLMAIVDAAERGWETDEIEFVIVKNLEGAREALKSDEADIFFWEKYTTNPYVASGEFRRLGVRETLWPAFVICVHQECLAQHASLVREILGVVNQACEELMQNPNAGELISERYGIQLEMVVEWFALTQWDTGFQKPLEQLQVAREFLEKLELAPVSNRPIEDLWFEL